MLDTKYIEELRELGGKEAKEALDEYAKTFNINVKKTRSFDNMVADLAAGLQELADEPMPEQSEGVTISELIDATDKAEGKMVFAEINPEAAQLISKEPDNGAELLIDSPLADKVKVIEVDVPIAEAITPAPEKVIKHVEIKQVIVEDFSPTVALIGPAPGYATIPYWVHDFIVETEDWKNKIHEFKHKNELKTLQSLVYYINKNGFVRIRESRNSRFYDLT